MASQKDNISLSFGVQGMERQTFQHQLDEKVFTFQRNGNLETDEESLGLTNEHSNLLCSRFNPGMVVIGHKYDSLNNQVYFFLTEKYANPVTNKRKSEIGSIKFNTDVSSIEDIEHECGCDFSSELSQPLENQTQIPHCNYETIITDDCNNCLNFDPNYPIYDIVLKQETCGYTMSFTDGNNPPRYIILNNLHPYTYTGSISCGIDETEPTCLDCEKLRIFPLYTIPCVTPKVIQFGGRLKRGKYEFTVAYCDKLGTEMSPYFSLTHPVSIFDKNNNILEQPHLANVTNLGIRVEVSNLDLRFNYYKVAVIQNADINGIVSPVFEGIHNITDNVILYTSDIDKPRTTLNHIFADKPNYKTWGGLVAANNYLIGYDYTLEKEWNLQPVVNFMGSFLRWQTVEAMENLYEDGVNDSLYTGYMRDEVYPFSIRFSTNEGYRTAIFPLVGRPGTVSEWEDVSNNSNKDVASIKGGMGDCSESERKYRWQYYNTGSVIDSCAVSSDTSGTEVIKQVTEQCVINDVGVIPAGSLTIGLDDTYTNLITWVQDHGTDICNINSPYYNIQLCSYLSNTYPSIICPDNWGADNIFPFPICTVNCGIGTCDTPVVTGTEIIISEVVNESSSLTEKPLNDYIHAQAPQNCQEYKPGTDASKERIIVGNCKLIDAYYRYTDFISNNSCSQYATFPANNQFFNTKIGTLISELITNIPSVANGTEFNAFLHKEARWYKHDFGTSDALIFETTTNNTSNCTPDVLTGNGNLRYTVYKSCTDNTVVQSGVFNVSNGLFIKLLKSDFPSGSFYIAIDVPIEQITLIGDTTDAVPILCQHDKYVLTPPCGCVNIAIRELEYINVVVTYDGIKLDKKMTYQSNCKFLVPELNGCDPVPHKYGKFAYWQSEEEYPDNSDLYNSSELNISPSDLGGMNTNLVQEFENYYVQNQQGGKYNWKTNPGNNKPITDFTCEPIRHFKFPDNRVISFMDDLPISEFSDNKIYPIGVTIDTDVINSFLDVAVSNGLITQEQRSSITGFELFRGDRSIHKSIVMKGIANDMYEDKIQSDSTQLTLFRNFPYNTLGDNAFLCDNNERTSLIKHPYNSTKNNRFSVIAPEIYYNRPTPGTEVSIEGYMYGNSIGGFKSLEGHSEWVILGAKAHKLADKLATLEVVFEGVMAVNEAILQAAQTSYTFAGAGGAGKNITGMIMGYIAVGVITAAQIGAGILFKQVKYRTQWLQTFEDLGNTHNFAEMFISGKGWYNSFIANKDEGNQLRGLVKSVYLKPGVPMFTEGSNLNGKPVRVNNRDREDSLYLSFGDTHFLEYPQKYQNYDNYSTAPNNASRYISSQTGCNNLTNNLRRIASPYFSIKNYIPNQYGKVDSVKWLSINHCGNLKDTEECKNIFGGDTKISRADFKNKTPLFTVYALNIANRIPFDYDRYENMGIPRFYCSYKSKEDSIGTLNMPYISTEFNFDCRPRGEFFYERPPNKMYTHLYGIPYFLVESEINCNYRYAGVEPHEQFASNGINVESWVQEKNTSIAFNNIFYYNQAYSKQQTGLPYRILPSVYDRETWDCLADSPNGVVYSQQDNSEVSLNDPWLVFRPFDIYQFRTDYGKLISMTNIESQQVLARFENNMSIFNAVDVLKERITPENEELGMGGMFAQRPIQFSFTELGETGSQHKAMVSSEFGHFWLDAKRGKVFQLQPNGQGLSPISDFRGKGNESGMRRWFKKYLPFKILKQKIDNLKEEHIDNPYKGLGILMWWDSKFKRVFITKRDYLVRRPYIGQITFSGGNFYLKTTNEQIELNNTKYFKDVSWTLSYSPIYQSWISYYDFKPDYAVAYNDYFQTGINYSSDSSEEGLWSHLLTNKSFQVFYGKKYPWEIEIPIKNNYVNNILQDVQVWMISKRYHNENDYAVWRKKGFNKAIIYNQTNNSGLLHLDYVDNHRKADYPKFVSSTEQKIAATHFEEQIHFNYFYNRVRKEDAHLPIWNWDDNEINRELNDKMISFNSKRVPERVRGDWFLVRLIQDNSSQFKQYFKWVVATEQPYK